ncbi:MAG: hypothetical protein IJA61_00675 [Clostridia bacterium]|nr:hypothetical protein [Clostridia bacterium]
MKKFWQVSKKPLVIAVIASILYIIDALIGGLFVDGGSFMWVGFAFWTVFFSASVKDRIKGLIGAVIGFLSAILMMFITSTFTLNVFTISISCLLGVFLVNGLVMYFEKTEKFWMNSITGIFVGIWLSFSGLGVGLNPLASFGQFGTMLGIILVYGVLGLLCAYFSIFFFNKCSKTEEKSVENKNEEGK